MTLSDTATAQLLETFRASGGAELIREAVELVLQELIEAEATAAVGAGRYERSEARTTARNGHRSRLLATRRGRPAKERQTGSWRSGPLRRSISWTEAVKAQAIELAGCGENGAGGALPARVPAETNWELERARCEVDQLTEAVKAQAIELAVLRGKVGWG